MNVKVFEYRVVSIHLRFEWAFCDRMVNITGVSSRRRQKQRTSPITFHSTAHLVISTKDLRMPVILLETTSLDGSHSSLHQVNIELFGVSPDDWAEAIVGARSNSVLLFCNMKP